MTIRQDSQRLEEIVGGLEVSSRKDPAAAFLRDLKERLELGEGGLREKLLGEDAVQLTAEALSPYVGEALTGVRREAPHVLDVYRVRARELLSKLAELLPPSPVLDGAGEAVHEVGEALEVERGVPAVARRKFFDVLAEHSLDEALEAAFAAAAPPSLELAGDPKKAAQPPTTREEVADGAADFFAGMRPASAAHVKLSAAVLRCLETGIYPDTVRRFVEEELAEAAEQGSVPARSAPSLAAIQRHSCEDGEMQPDSLGPWVNIEDLGGQPPAGREEAPRLFKINRLGFSVPDGPITGEQLRRLPTPPLLDEYDLYRSLGGGLPDPLVVLTEAIEIAPGDEFYSVPKAIAAGREEALREALEEIRKSFFRELEGRGFEGDEEIPSTEVEQALDAVIEQAILDSNPSPAQTSAREIDEDEEGDSPDDPPVGDGISARPAPNAGGAPADRSATVGTSPNAGVQEGAGGSRSGRPSNNWHVEGLEALGRACEECEDGICRDGAEWAPCPNCFPPESAFQVGTRVRNKGGGQTGSVSEVDDTGTPVMVLLDPEHRRTPEEDEPIPYRLSDLQALEPACTHPRMTQTGDGHMRCDNCGRTEPDPFHFSNAEQPPLSATSTGGGEERFPRWRCQKCRFEMAADYRACPRCGYMVFDPIPSGAGEEER